MTKTGGCPGRGRSGARRAERARGALLRRVLVTIAGAALCAIGIALLVLPGPGLLLVLAGLVLLANEYPWARRLVAPVRGQAWRAARESVASPLRVTATAVCGLVLVGAGIAWMLVPSLPLGGISTGSSLIVSGLILLGLLGYTYHRVRRGDTELTDDECVNARL